MELLTASPAIATLAREESSADARLHRRLGRQVTAREKDSDEDTDTDDDSDCDEEDRHNCRMEQRYARRCLVGDEADKVEAVSGCNFENYYNTRPSSRRSRRTRQAAIGQTHSQVIATLMWCPRGSSSACR